MTSKPALALVLQRLLCSLQEASVEGGAESDCSGLVEDEMELTTADYIYLPLKAGKKRPKGHLVVI